MSILLLNLLTLLNMFDYFNHVPHSTFSPSFCDGADVPFLSIIKCRDEDRQHWENKLDELEPYRKHFKNKELKVTDYKSSPLRISFEHFVDLPMGLQDNAGGIISNHLISIGGFCGGNFPYYDTPYCCGERGFLKTTYAINLETNKWFQLDSFPGIARQGHKCATFKNELYCWGGFSYTPAPLSMSLEVLRKTKKANPYGYIDGFKLNKNFKWQKLPNLPENQAAFTNLCELNGFIYLIGGAYYDLNQFHTIFNSKKIGSMMWKFDISQNKWFSMSDLPGTPRMNHATICIHNKIYVFGGCTSGVSITGSTTFQTVIDNWVFNISNDKWYKLPNTPYGLGNWGLTNVNYLNKYIILVGGMGYNKTHPSNPLNYRRVYSNAIVVYDIEQQKFFYTDPLPMNINIPMVIQKNNTLYIVGGEGGSGCLYGNLYGQHLNLALKATIHV